MKSGMETSDPAARDAPGEPGRPRPWSSIAVAVVDGLAGTGPDLLLAALSARSGLACRPLTLAPAPLLEPLAGRPQIDADRLLVRLEEAARSLGQVPLVGVTGRDLGVPLFTFVFGRARLGGAAALVSTARLRPELYGQAADPSLVARRAAGEILHELGHLAGRIHCEDPGCVMRFAASVEAADLRGDRFCPSCAAALPPGLAPARDAAGERLGPSPLRPSA